MRTRSKAAGENIIFLNWALIKLNLLYFLGRKLNFDGKFLVMTHCDAFSTYKHVTTRHTPVFTELFFATFFFILLGTHVRASNMSSHMYRNQKIIIISKKNIFFYEKHRKILVCFMCCPKSLFFNGGKKMQKSYEKFRVVAGG